MLHNTACSDKLIHEATVISENDLSGNVSAAFDQFYEDTTHIR